MEGWLKLHRKITDSAVFDNPNLLKVWIWCLCKASHKKHDVVIGKQVVNLSPGQFVFGRLKAAEYLKMNDRTVYDYMKLLEKLKMIVISSNNKFSLITIVNWDFYQADNRENQQQDTQQNAQQDTQQDTQQSAIKNDTYNNDKQCYYNDVDNEKNGGEYNAHARPFNSERAWNDTFELYPQKNNYNEAKQLWEEKVFSALEQKDEAGIIYRAIRMYLNDYKSKYDDDANCKFVKSLARWLREDSAYWIAKVRKEDEEIKVQQEPEEEHINLWDEEDVTDKE